MKGKLIMIKNLRRPPSSKERNMCRIRAFKILKWNLQKKIHELEEDVSMGSPIHGIQEKVDVQAS